VTVGLSPIFSNSFLFARFDVFRFSIFCVRLYLPAHQEKFKELKVILYLQFAGDPSPCLFLCVFFEYLSPVLFVVSFFFVSISSILDRADKYIYDFDLSICFLTVFFN